MTSMTLAECVNRAEPRAPRADGSRLSELWRQQQDGAKLAGSHLCVGRFPLDGARDPAPFRGVEQS